MAFQPYEALWIVKESAYLTQKLTPVAGTDSIYIRLAGANRFSPRPVPQYVTIPFGGGFAIDGYRKAAKYVISGNLELELCYSQAQLLLDWAITRINVAQTSPWTTTEPAGDLASCTVYHAVMRSDGSIKRRRYKGVKVHNWKLSVSEQNPQVMLTLGLQGSKMDGNSVDSTSDPDATAFPLPADTAFPTDLVTFLDMASGLSVGGSPFAYPTELTVQATNAMDPLFFTSAFVAIDRMRGRQSSLDGKGLYTATPDWRAALEAVTSEAVTVAFTNTHVIQLDFKAQNVFTKVDDDLAPGKNYLQGFTLTNQYDPSASADVAFTYTP